jgi:hypothetical protein
VSTTYYLGVEVQQQKDFITLKQSSYARKLVERGGLSSCKPCQTPMEEKLKLFKESTMAKVDATKYRSIIRGLRYLTHMRPNIRFTVGYLSRLMADPREDHVVVVKILLRYVAGTIDHGINDPRRKNKVLALIGFNDNDMAGDVDGRKSTSGVLFMLNSCPITWQSKKQRVVTLSTCEAEYIATTTTCCQGLWLRWLMEELTGEKLSTPALTVDIKSAIALANNPILHGRSKHIDVRYHFIRDYVEEGLVLTKPLDRLRHQELVIKIGVEEIKQSSTIRGKLLVNYSLLLVISSRRLQHMGSLPAAACL